MPPELLFFLLPATRETATTLSLVLGTLVANCLLMLLFLDKLTSSSNARSHVEQPLVGTVHVRRQGSVSLGNVVKRWLVVVADEMGLVGAVLIQGEDDSDVAACGMDVGGIV